VNKKSPNKMLKYLTKPQGVKIIKAEKVELKEKNPQESKLFNYIS
jgi:hypothetical protein